MAIDTECAHLVITPSGRHPHVFTCSSCGAHVDPMKDGALVCDRMTSATGVAVVRLVRVSPGGSVAWIELLELAEAMIVSDQLRELAGRDQS